MVSNKNSLCYLVILTTILFSCRTSFPQSQIIFLPGQESSHAYSSPNDLPNSSSRLQESWEAILLKPNSRIAEGPRTVSRLLRELEAIGLPVKLNYTAQDDQLSPETEIETLWPMVPLLLRLNMALEDHNAILTMRGERLDIISLDVSTDSEFFHTLTYDISRLNLTAHSLSTGIRSIVDPYEWSDTNGDNELLFENVNGHQLMTLSAPFRTHLKIRRMLSVYRRMSGVGHKFAWQDSKWKSANSRIVELPRSLDIQPRAMNMQRSRSRGAGGLGGGGGVF